MAKTRKIKSKEEIENRENNRLEKVKKNEEFKKIQIEKKIKNKKLIEEGKILPIINDRDKKDLERFGFKFREENNGNFQEITMPDKWEIKKDKHNYLYFLDREKRKRISIIFFNDKYNSRYDIIILRRYNLNVITNKEKKYVYGIVSDFNEIIYKTNEIKYEEELFSGNYFKKFDKVYSLAKKYVDVVT